MSSAIEKLNAQRGVATTIPQPRGDKGVDLDNFLVDAVNHLNIKMDLRSSITDGNLVRTMDGASTIDVTVHDPTKTLLSSSLWDYNLEVEVDGMWFRLVNVNKTGDDVILTFQDRVVSWLQEHKTPIKVSRNKLTRAEFVKKMVDEIKLDNKLKVPITFYSPELKKKQPQATPDDRKKSNKKRVEKAGGLSLGDGLRAKNEAMIQSQIDIAEKILDVGVQMNANRKVLVSSMMVAIDESDLTNLEGGDRDSVGVFQQRASQGWTGLRNITKAAQEYFKAAIAYDKAHPSVELRLLCQGVQRSATSTGANYFRYQKEAKAIVDAYGATSSGSVTRDYYKQFQFTRGQPGGPKGENTWQAGNRLAEQVRWRFFVVQNTDSAYVYFVADRDLISAKAVMTIDEDSEGINQIDFDYDIGKDTNEATITCRADRWFADPGEVVVLKSTMGPAKGRWLVSTIARPLFDTETTITIRRAQVPKKEPAPDLASSTKNTTPIMTGGVTKVGDGLVYPLPIHGTDLGGVAAHMARPFGNWMSDNAVDIGCPKGTHVLAVEDGIITKLTGSYDGTGQANPNGFNVYLKGDSGRVWFYTHMEKRVLGPVMRVGARFTAGQQIGWSGAANGVFHLHIAVDKGDPEKLLKVG